MERIGFDIFARDNASSVFDRVGRSAQDTEGAFGKVGKGMKAVGKAAAIGLAAGVGVAAVALTKFVGEARESERVGKLTESIIKSTGGAAKISAVDVGNLATAISNKTGVDDEAIQTGSNLLLTFKGVRNEVGKGNQVFNDATAAAVDLSAAGFGSIESASMMLGKALNDPLKGLTALGKAGVTFTAQQKEQIKTLVKSGDALGAQKIILGEVEAQVGGAAAATGNAVDKLKVTLGNLGETVGTAILPAVDKAATAVSGFVSGVTATFQAGGFSAVFAMVGAKISEALPGIKDSLRQWGTAIASWLREAVPMLASNLVGWGKAFVEWIPTMLAGVDSGITGLSTKISAALPGIKVKLGQWGTAFWAWLQDAVPPIMTKLGELGGRLLGWITGVALPMLVSSLVRWGRAFVEWIQPMVPPALAALGVAAGRLFAWVMEVGLPRLHANLRQWGTAFVTWIAPMVPPALAEFAKLTGRFVAWIVGTGVPIMVTAMAKLGLELVKWIGPMIPAAVAEIAKLGARLVAWIVGEGGPMVRARMAQMGRDAVLGFIDGIRNMAGAAAAAAGDMASAAVAKAKAFLQISSPSKVFIGIGENVAEGLSIGIKSTEAVAVAAAEGLANRVVAAVDAVKARQEAKSSFIAGIFGTITGGGNLSGLGSGEGAASAATMIAELASKVTAAREFAANLKQLSSLGLTKTAIAELAQAGVEQSGVFAAAMVEAGAGSIKTINHLQAQLGVAAASTANFVGASMYDAGIRAAQGVAKGLMDKRADIYDALDEIAKGMAAKLRKALKISSPSKVFMRLGQFTGQGFVDGVASMGAASQSAIAGLVGSPGGAAPRGLTAVGGASSQGTTVEISVVSLDPRGAAVAVKEALAEYVRRNGPISGLVA